MQAHLTDEQMLEQLISQSAGAGEAAGREHLASCPACREEHESLRCVLGRYAKETRAAAERPEDFWQRQQAVLAERWAEQPASRRLAWAGAAVMVLLAAVLLIEKTPPAVRVAETDADQALLVEVERSVRRELPRALEPAALLAQEVSRTRETKGEER